VIFFNHKERKERKEHTSINDSPMIRLHPNPIIFNHGISLNSTEKSPDSFREISVSFRGLKTASPFGCGAAALRTLCYGLSGLVFGIWNFVGIWRLEFGISRRQAGMAFLVSFVIFCEKWHWISVRLVKISG